MMGEMSGFWWLLAVVSGAVGSGILVYGIRQKDGLSVVFGALLSFLPMTVGVAWQSALIAVGLVLDFIGARRFIEA